MGNHLQVYIQIVQPNLFRWYSTTETAFAIGCAITMILAFFTMALPAIRKAFANILYGKDNDERSYVPLTDSV